MSDPDPAHPVEFIRLNGQAVRVTSWKPGSEPGSFDLVTITRGSRDAELFEDLLNQSRLTLEAGAGPAMTVAAGGIDRRTFGEGQSRITRFSVVLTASDDIPTPDPRPELSLEARIVALEAEVSQLRRLVKQHANGVRH